jgi:hypothetical protein
LHSNALPLGALALLALLQTGCFVTPGYRIAGGQVRYVSGPTCQARPVPEAEAPLFEVLDRLHGRDRSHVFYGGRVLPGADPATFRLLRPGQSRDDRFLYLFGAPVPACHAASLRLLDFGWMADDRCAYAPGAQALGGSDGPSFVPLSPGLGKDRGRVYFYGERIEGADAATFQLDCEGRLGPRGRDQAHCYRGRNVVACGCSPGAPNLVPAPRPASEAVDPSWVQLGNGLRGRLVGQTDEVDDVELEGGTRAVLPAGSVPRAGARRAAPRETVRPETCWDVVPALSLRLSAPQGWALGAGLMKALPGPGGNFALVGQVEAGPGGGKAHLGYALGAPYLVFLGTRAVWLRTWGQPTGGVKPGQDFAGAEATLSLGILNGFLGGYRRVAGPAGQPDWLFSAGWGLALGP